MTAVRYTFDLKKACDHINRYTRGKVISVDTLEEWADMGLFKYQIEDGNYKIRQKDISTIEIYKNLIVDQQKTVEQAKAEFDKVLEKKEKELQMQNHDIDITLDEESALISLIREYSNAQILNIIEVEETLRRQIEKMNEELVRMNLYYQTELDKKNKEIEKKEMELMYEKKYKKELNEQLDEIVRAGFIKTFQLKKKYKK